MCQSEDVEESVPIFEYDELLRVEKFCELCGVVWYDRYKFDGIDFPDDDNLFT